MAAPYYVTHNAGGGGVGSEGDPFTLVEAADNVAAGETVYVKASGVYEVEDGANNCVLNPTTSGSITAPVLWQGYFDTINDGGIVTINADPAGDQFSYGIFGGGTYQVFKNFEIKGASSYGVYTAGGDYWTMKNCNAHNNGNAGFLIDNYTKFENCSSNNNTGDGFQMDVEALFVSCIAYINAGWGFTCQTGVYYNCLTYANTSGCFQFDDTSATNPHYIFGCTMDGEADADPGINFVTSGSAMVMVAVVNNIIYDTTLGIDADDDIKEFAIARNNLFNDNGTDVNNFLPVSAGGVGTRGDVTTAPNFENEAGDDYTPGATSNALAKGLDAHYTVAFWNDYNNGAGDNPPAE